MKKSILLLSLLTSMFSYGQENLKERALQEFKEEDYHRAVSSLEEALKQLPNDAETYYYLGFFNHYIGSDSRLYAGYDTDFSEKILSYLDKAIALKPDYGDAKYFYGAECATRAFKAMQDRDADEVKRMLQRAYDKGAFPKWLLELGRNMLDSCLPNSLLFAAGDADLNTMLYLQVVERFRPDVTVMPIANIDRPWYMLYLKEGLTGVTPKINLVLSEQQIMQIRPFKWRAVTVDIEIGKEAKTYYGLSEEAKMEWTVEPDLISERMHSKYEGEKARKRTYLSPQRANLLQIIEDNYSERPIFFSNMGNPTMYGGLDSFFENFGLVSRLAPMITVDTPYEVNYQSVENVIKSEKLTDYATILTDPIPRIGGAVFFYHYWIEKLVTKYNEEKDKKKLANLKKLYSSKLAIGLNKDYEDYIMGLFEPK